MNKAVARFADGRVEKGSTFDFSPGREVFHLASLHTPEHATGRAIRTMDLKALFFVKDFDGNPLHVEKKEFGSATVPELRRIRATFRDGEVLVGTTAGYHSGSPGFFVVPADPESNNERCYVVASATTDVQLM